MDNKNKYLIIPDIHGRTYWKDVLKNHPIDEFEKVIFLGDYLDPYPFEGITVKDAIENFKEIIKFKSEHQDKVILLIGNHDFYYYSKLTGPSRYAYYDKDEIEMLFEDDRDFFQFAFETKKTLFTHAGVLNGWMDSIKTYTDGKFTVIPTAESINEIAKEKEFMGMVSRERGGRYGYGSPIWADVSEHHYNSKYKGKFQIFGHSLQLDLIKYYETNNPDDISSGNPILETKLNYAMLDCRSAFIYDEGRRKSKKMFTRL